MKIRIFLALIIISVSALTSCWFESGAKRVEYVNEEFGYRISYPSGWSFDELAPETALDRVDVSPADSDYKRIQIAVFPKSRFVAMSSQAIVYALHGYECGKPTALSSKPDVGKWDWKITFEVTCEDEGLSGVAAFEESGNATYAITMVHQADDEWPEGEAVIDSFEIVP
ncbi:MAG: hypothetical protein ACLFPU_05140 [Dehalococcoidia bacterium]